MKKVIFLGAILCAFSFCANAEPLSGAEVSDLFSDGKLRFVAGSVGDFQADGSYTFRHGSSSQSGNYVISSDGVVTFTDRNTEHSFMIDRNENGKLDLIYTGGPQSGDKYRLR